MGKKDNATKPVKAPRSVRLRMRTLERIAPRRAAAAAEKMWFTVPPAPPEKKLQRFTPKGGAPFFLMCGESEVQGSCFGPEDGPVALLVHGWGGHWQQLGAHVEPLVEAGYQVVVYDAPSHGRSTHGAHEFGEGSVMEMTDAVVAVSAEFGRPSLVVTHSIGAIAALRAARQTRPADAYVMIAPQLALEPAIAWFEDVVEMGPRTRELFLERTLARVGLPMEDFDVTRDVERLAAEGTMPSLLVVHDQQDPDAPVEQARRLAELWPQAQLMLTEGQGHRKVIWHKEVVKRVAGFVDGLPASPHGHPVALLPIAGAQAQADQETDSPQVQDTPEARPGVEPAADERGTGAGVVQLRG